MKRIKIFKAYFIVWLFVYFIAVSNLEVFLEYFLSTLTFNIAIVSLLAIGTTMILIGSKELTMIAGTFGVLMYKKGAAYKYLDDIEKNFPSNIATKIKSRSKQGILLFTEQDKEEILTWIDEKFSNQNKYNNFFIGTVLMIGLLGTFSGLLGAIGSMASIVASLAGGDVNIGQIMAKFSQPLSSMAVGFGSSLFGVISAILLSIKGYLLNKAQATLLTGVENWLNEKTLEPSSQENSTPTAIPSNMLQDHQKSFMDVFIEQVSSLSYGMKEITESNHEFKTVFEDHMIKMKRDQERQMQQMIEIQVDFKKELAKSLGNLYSSQNDAHLKLQELTLSQIQSKKESSALIKSIDVLSEETFQTRSQLSQKDKILMDLVLKQAQNDKDREIEFFQIIDTMESLDKNIKNINTSEKQQKNKAVKSIKNYLKYHFSSSKKEDVT